MVVGDSFAETGSSYVWEEVWRSLRGKIMVRRLKKHWEDTRRL